ncbi:hypothetical protein JCM10212_003147 [Sporobolomyces blumeae]
MLNVIRGIVSGNKARYKEEGFDLDLVRITDRMIIMGYPAAGLASLYRNKRSDVIRFLEPYEGRFRIFNLCPLYENSYDASEFARDVEVDNSESSHGFGGSDQQEARRGKASDGNKVVERYPWPDHHPPPLSLMRIMVEGAKEWYEAGDGNVIVIHCKAGKGRSGTFAISILMALPGLPSAPSDEADQSDDNVEEEHGAEDEAEDPSDQTTTNDLRKVSRGDQDKMSIQDKLDYLLKFHTSRRMAPGTKSLGVSISSQRRFLSYFGRILSGDDPRSVPPAVGITANGSATAGAPKRRIVLEYVKVRGEGLKGGPANSVLGKARDRIAVQVWRYKDSIAANLRQRELDLVPRLEAGHAGAPTIEREDEVIDWDDRSKMFVHVGGLVEAHHVERSEPRTRTDNTSGGPEPGPTSEDRTSTDSTESLLPDEIAGREALERYDSDAETVTPYPPPSVPGSTSSSRSASRARSRDQEPTFPSAKEQPGGKTRERLLVPYTSFLDPSPSLPPFENAKPRSRSEAIRHAEASPRDGARGIELDGEREVMLKVLIGKEGNKHGRLPTMAALALTWFIPLFESPPPPSAMGGSNRTSTTSVLTLSAKDLDFVKPFAGIDEVEIGWRWIV